MCANRSLAIVALITLAGCGGPKQDPSPPDRDGLVLELEVQRRVVAPGESVQAAAWLRREPSGAPARCSLLLSASPADGAEATVAVDLELTLGGAEGPATAAELVLPARGTYLLAARCDLGDGQQPLVAATPVAARDRVGQVPDELLAFEEHTLAGAGLVESAAAGVPVTLPAPGGSLTVILAPRIEADAPGLTFLSGAAGTLMVAEEGVQGVLSDGKGGAIFYEPLSRFVTGAPPGATLVYASRDLVIEMQHEATTTSAGQPLHQGLHLGGKGGPGAFDA